MRETENKDPRALLTDHSMSVSHQLAIAGAKPSKYVAEIFPTGEKN